MKKSVTTLLSALLILSISPTVFAQDPNETNPCSKPNIFNAGRCEREKNKHHSPQPDSSSHSETQNN